MFTIPTYTFIWPRFFHPDFGAVALQVSPSRLSSLWCYGCCITAATAHACVCYSGLNGECLGTGMESLELKLSTSISEKEKSPPGLNIFYCMWRCQMIQLPHFEPNKKIRKKGCKTSRFFRRTGSLWLCLLRSHHHPIPWWTTRRTFRSHKEVFRRVLDQGAVRWRYCRT